MSGASIPFPSNIEAVLFDIDGTLADTDPVHFQTFVDLLQREGVNGGDPIDFAFFQRWISGRQNKLICADLFPQWDEQKVEEWSDMKEAMFRERSSSDLKAMGGLDRFLAWIDAQNFQRAAVTNAPRLNAEFILGCIGRGSYFQEVIIGDECEKAKPDPCPYLAAMSRLGVQPENCIVFEDSPSGARAAVAAGIYTIGILSSNPAEKLQEVGCSLLIDNYDSEDLWRCLDAVSEKRSSSFQSA